MNALKCGMYEISFQQGGVSICKNDKCLYYNQRPIYVSVKTIAAISIFRDEPYEQVESTESGVKAWGILHRSMVLNFL